MIIVNLYLEMNMVITGWSDIFYGQGWVSGMYVDLEPEARR